MKRSVFFILCLALVLLAAFWAAGRPLSVINSEAMGTLLTVKGEKGGLAVAEIRRLEHLFSRFDPSSEVSRINAAAGRYPVAVSTETFFAIEQAIGVSRRSDGAFDITLGRGGSYRDILLARSGRTVFLKKRGMMIDLGGIGKGYAIECARRLLRSRGVNKALLDMRSSIAVIGGPWKIGLQDPQNPDRMLLTIVLHDGDALSTSGQYEQPGHIIDPRNGRKADACLSATVITGDAGMADAFSTAVFVLGPVKGMGLLKKIDARGIIITKSGKMITNGKIV